MKKTLYIFIIIFFSFSCNHISDNNQQDYQLKEDVFVFPEVIDTFRFDLKYKVAEDFLRSNYRPLYIGVDTSNLFVDYNIQKFYYAPPTIRELDNDTSQSSQLWGKYWDKYQIYYDEYPMKEYVYWDSAQVQIIIDTTQTVANIGYFKTYKEEKKYEAYPVIIKNKDSSSVIIGFGSHLPLIIEAKTNEGEWFPLEYPYYYPCGNGIPHLILPKKNIIISSLPITQGEDKLKLRLNLGNIYSNVIHGNLTLANKPDITTR